MPAEPGFPPPSLASGLQREFAATSRAAGLAIFRGGGVSGFRAADVGSGALVFGTNGLCYSAAIQFLGDAIHARCSCPAARRSPTCEHLFALLLEFDAFHAANALAGREPRWFVSEGRPPVPVAWRDPLARGDALHALASRGWVAASVETIQASEVDWRSAVARLKQTHERRPATSRAERTLRLGFALRVDVRGRLCVAVFSTPLRGRNADKWSPRFLPTDAKRESLDPHDRRRLALLMGQPAVDLEPWGDPDRCDRVLVPELLDLVLAELEGSAELRWLDPDEGETDFGAAPRCEIDRGEPLRFVAELVSKAEDFELVPRLVRGDEVHPFSAVLAIAGDRVRIGDRLLRWDAGSASGLVTQLTLNPPLRVPGGERDELLAELAALPDAAALAAPAIAAGGVPPRPKLVVHAPASGTSKSVAVELAFRYGDHELLADAADGLVRVDEGWRRRDAHAEQAAGARLAELGVAPQKQAGLGLPRAGLGAVLRTLLAEGWLVEAEKQALLVAGTPRFAVRSGIDWFELQAELPFGSSTIRLAAVIEALARKQDFVTLADGRRGLLPEHWVGGWDRLLSLGERSADGLRFRPSQTALLDALLAAFQGEVDVDRNFAEHRERLRSFSRITAEHEPAGFRGALRPYQREGLGWLAFLAQMGFGGCLADDMGLGKTVQVLARLATTHAEAKRAPSLVVAPRSLVFNWLREAARFVPGLRVREFSSATRFAELGIAPGQRPDPEALVRAFADCEVVITTYGALLRDIPLLREVPFHYVVLDESSAIKNAQSQTAKAVRLLRAEHRLALSGTPVENHLDELWSIFEFLNPGMLGRSAAFRELSSGEARGAVANAGLRDALRPFVLRRTKDQVLTELPKKSEQLVECALEGPQRKFYDELRDGIRASLLERLDVDGLAGSQIHVLAALLRLRQAACHPALVGAEFAEIESAKLAALLPMLEELAESGHKALVFSQFVQFLSLLREQLDARGLRYAYLDGKTRKRAEEVERFQGDPTLPLFLISLKAGGHGLNLTAADYVFILDPWWNPAVEAQAVDRAHRMGQTRHVMAYRLIARDTIEQRVLDLQASKKELIGALFAEDGAASMRDLSREDIERLLE
jgi:superfamily II DNA or RNA helicase